MKRKANRKRGRENLDNFLFSRNMIHKTYINVEPHYSINLSILYYTILFLTQYLILFSWCSTSKVATDQLLYAAFRLFPQLSSWCDALKLSNLVNQVWRLEPSKPNVFKTRMLFFFFSLSLFSMPYIESTPIPNKPTLLSPKIPVSSSVNQSISQLANRILSMSISQSVTLGSSWFTQGSSFFPLGS